MEHILEYMDACCAMTLDIKELWRILEVCSVLYSIACNRISELTGALFFHSFAKE